MLLPPPPGHWPAKKRLERGVPIAVHYVQNFPDVLERILLLGCLRSLGFYRKVRAQLGVYDEEFGDFRSAFQNPDCLAVWPLVVSHWELVIRCGIVEAQPIQASMLEQYFVEKLVKFAMDKEIANRIFDEVTTDMREIQLSRIFWRTCRRIQVTWPG